MVPYYAFWQEGCEAMVRNISEILRLAGEPVTAENVCKFARTMAVWPEELKSEWWRQKYCCRCMERAFTKTRDTAYFDLFQKAEQWLLVYFPKRTQIAKEMMIDATVGVLSSFRESG
jgi:hypothetical protein